MKKNYTVTLGRAHKILERIGAKVNELSEKAKRLALPIAIQGVSDGMIARVQAQGDEVIGVLAEYEKFIAARNDIRAAVGNANATRGIGDILTRTESNNKIISLLKEIIDGQEASGRTTMLRPSELKDYRSLGASESPIMRSSLQLAVLSVEQVATHTARKAALEKENFVLNDKKTDLNSASVSFDLDVSVADEVGLGS